MKIGLEIHAQLNTKKLFCDCDTDLLDNPTKTIERKLHVTVSELEEVDRAAFEESLKGKKHVYEAFDTSCLVYLDEEPPHEPNEEAIETVLKVSLLLNADIVDQIHFMRKIVIDGSNVSGFQRTAIVGLNGVVETDYGNVEIPTICIEEDAARKDREEKDRIFWKIDRLGTPLIEIATSPSIKTPEQGREVALFIGNILKATKKIKRGIGTIRQDLNISIDGGARIEIKGVQELNMIPTYIKEEVKRQENLLKIKEELEKRKAGIGEIYDITDLFKDTKCKIIKKAEKVLALKLKNFSGILGMEIQKDRRFGSELADYARKYVPGIFHSDELPGYGISEEEKNRVTEKLESDSFVIVASSKEKAEKALKEVIKRIKIAFQGVPEETRKPLENGATAYARPLPGEARMYPETDVPPYNISEELIEKIKRELPELPRDKKIRLMKQYNLNEENATKIMAYDPDFFEEIMREYSIKPTIFLKVVEIYRSLGCENLEDLKIVFDYISKNRLVKEGIEKVLEEFSKGNMDIERIIENHGLKPITESDAEEVIQRIVIQNRDVIEKKGERAVSVLMGECMKVLRGKVDGKIVNEILRREIEKIK
ncbi:MAG TPA: Glu-tRNA(Gln) amidotransferase subunit GatE [Methanomicrobia archaeon]|nr:Glu-tRNA(Gln) amidotransferase subunit GatE [Methanomicrobia archaeon]